MCGIFALINKNNFTQYDKNILLKEFMKIKHRGPDNTNYVFCSSERFDAIQGSQMSISGLGSLQAHKDRINNLKTLRSKDFSNYGGFDTIINKITGKNKFHNQIMDKSNIFMGFHRLSINDLSKNGNQPFFSPDGNVSLICNGEIYNYKELAYEYNLNLKSNSDCEIILHLYFKIGFINTIKLLDGVFACVLYDKKNDVIHAARDPIGIRSLYIGYNPNGTYGFCSELKGICLILDNIKQFNPGCTWNSKDNQFNSYTSIKSTVPRDLFEDTIEDKLNNMDISDLSNKVWSSTITQNITEKYILQQNIRNRLTDSIKKRLLADRPIGCLLSGGFDSSIIAALLARELNKTGKKLKTFSVGLSDSTDLKYAKIVANYINSEHHELILSEREMLNGIEDTIKQFETWDVTTIRAGTPMFLLAKYIKIKFNTTIIMSGEAADESSGSYLYFKNAPDNLSFQQESERLMNDLCYYDVLRVDKSISGAGLECRIPFIDRDFLDFYMNINPMYKKHEYGGIEKYLLRSSFENENLLPKEVLWRRKEAFSDGVSSNERSWYTIIQEYADTIYPNRTIKSFNRSTKLNNNTPYSKESMLFRDIFKKYYPKNIDTIPYYWVPKFMGEIMEPSARVLKFN